MRFWKYQGTGNDFIMLDGRSESVKISVSELQKLCDRRFGIGADGLIILKKHPDLDFEMDYYNSDGSQSFCGNGSRCAQAFALQLGMIQNTSAFLAIDGVHQGRIQDDWFETKMGDVNEIKCIGKDFFINTGSPHYVQFVEDVENFDVKKEGAAIRYSEQYRKEGTNVNFVQEKEGSLRVRTYERGVEDETYSCGTGVTAVAIAYLFKNAGHHRELFIETKGGSLKLKLQRCGEELFKEIWLCGPAELVYTGEI